jgi:signal transduction histidine kinase
MGAAAKALNEESGSVVTRDVLDVAATMEAEERRSLALRAAEARNARRAVVISEGVAVTLLSVTLVGGFVWIRRELRARLAAQAALEAIEKRQLEAARIRAEELEQHVRERTAQLRTLAADLEMTEFRERRKLAHDLHDDLCQLLAAARIRLAPLTQSTQPDVRSTAIEVDGLIDQVNQSTRSLAARLAPAELDELGLAAALTSLAAEMQRTFGLKVEVFDSGCEGYLSEASRSILYRAVRELLINAAKHARTEYAEVDCEESNGEIIVRVADNGVGFDPARITSGGQGLGLATIRQRLLFIGGTLEISSIPGDGTVAVLRAPVERRASARVESEA